MTQDARTKKWIWTNYALSSKLKLDAQDLVQYSARAMSIRHWVILPSFQMLRGSRLGRVQSSFPQRCTIIWVVILWGFGSIVCTVQDPNLHRHHYGNAWAVMTYQAAPFLLDYQYSSDNSSKCNRSHVCYNLSRDIYTIYISIDVTK